MCGHSACCCSTCARVVSLEEYPFDAAELTQLLRKISRAQFEAPPHFSSGLRDLLSRVLVVRMAERLTLAEICRHAWVQAAGGALQLEAELSAAEAKHAAALAVEESPSLSFADLTALVLRAALLRVTGIRVECFTSQMSSTSLVEALSAAIEGCDATLESSRTRPFFQLLFRSATREMRIAVCIHLLDVKSGVALVHLSLAEGRKHLFEELLDRIKPTIDALMN